MSRGTRKVYLLSHSFRLRDCNPLWFAFPCDSATNVISQYTGFSPFARRYLENRCFFPFLRLLRWFSSPGSLQHAMYSHEDDMSSHAGLPHSEICGSKIICILPQLIAACHVLHRLWMPRHSPCALNNLILRYVRVEIVFTTLP